MAGEVEFTQVTVPVRAPEGKTEVRVERVFTLENVVRAVANWGRALFRNLMSLLIVGLLLAWLYPRLLSGSGETLKIRPWASLGVGVLTGIVFWLVMPVLSFVLFAVVLLVGLFSVGGLFFPALLIMILILMVLFLAFLISGSFFSKLIICQVIGQLILGGFKSPAANHRFFPWLLGLVIFILATEHSLCGLDRQYSAVLFGLGAFVLWFWVQQPVWSLWESPKSNHHGKSAMTQKYSLRLESSFRENENPARQCTNGLIRDFSPLSGARNGQLFNHPKSPGNHPFRIRKGGL